MNIVESLSQVIYDQRYLHLHGKLHAGKVFESRRQHLCERPECTMVDFTTKGLVLKARWHFKIQIMGCGHGTANSWTKLCKIYGRHNDLVDAYLCNPRTCIDPEYLSNPRLLRRMSLDVRTLPHLKSEWYSKTTSTGIVVDSLLDSPEYQEHLVHRFGDYGTHGSINLISSQMISIWIPMNGGFHFLAQW